jgi:hypothetical protein
MANLDGKQGYSVSSGRFTPASGWRKDQITSPFNRQYRRPQLGAQWCVPQLPIKAAVDVTGGSVANRSVHRRASVPLEILVHLGGTAPLRVQPDENSQGANLQGTGRKNLHLPQTGIIDCRHIGRPYRPPCGEQASEALFRRNAERISPATGLTGRLSDGRVHRRSRQIEIAFASRVPVYELGLIVLSHSFYSATKGAARACYNRNVDGLGSGGKATN